MGLSATMEIGKSGLRAYQVATEVTSQNIANVNTEGYSRQRVILQTATSTTHNGFPLGNGVSIQTVERYYDSLLQQQIVTAATTSGYDTTKSEVLTQIEPTFNAITETGLGSSISSFFSSWQDLSTNASGTTERQMVLSKANIMVDSFKSVSTTLNTAISTQDQSLPTQVTEINSKLTQIAKLNDQIRQTELVSGNANEMRDQRDLLVQQLSEDIGVKYTENADGTTDVYVAVPADPAVLTPAYNLYLVQGNQAGSLTTGGTSPATTVTIHDAGGVDTIDVDPLATPQLYTSPDGGKLWATMELRDITIPDYLAKVDTLASGIINAVNTQHVLGFDLAGAAGTPFFSGTTAATIGVSITDTANIAAAGTGASAPGGNANALLIAGLSSTYTTSYNTLVSEIGADVSSAKTVVSQDEAFVKQLSTLRDSKSGVSLDEELTNLIKYQRSYQASAKVINTATEMMDTVMGLIR